MLWRPARGKTVDALSDVLKTVRLTGAVFFDVVARAPWVMTWNPEGVAGAAISHPTTTSARKTRDDPKATRERCVTVLLPRFCAKGF